MPYELKRVSKSGAKQYEVVNMKTGKGHGRTSKEKGMAQKRLLDYLMSKKEK